MGKVQKKIYHYLRMRSIYRRVKILSVAIGAAAMILITAISVGINIHSTMALLQERESSYLSVYASSISGKLSQISRDLSGLAGSRDMQRMLGETLSLNDRSYLNQKMVLTREAEQYLAYNDAVSDIYLFTTRTGPMNLFRGPHSDLDVEELDTISLFYDTSFFSEKGAYLADAAEFSTDLSRNQQGIACLQRVIETGTVQTRGYLFVYLDKEILFGNLDDREKNLNGVRRMIISDSGSLVYTAGGEKSEKLLDQIKENMNQKEGAFSLGTSGSFWGGMCVYSRINGLDFYAVTVIPYSVVSREILLILLAMFILLALLLCIYSLMSKSIAQSISIPTEEILQSLREIQKENFSVGLYDSHSDELAEVNNFMNDTKRHLSELIMKIQETEKQRYRLRLQVLRTQINPHFLVNTLNSIIWLAKLQGADNIRSLTSSLIDVLLPCMRNTSGVATIGDEIELLHDYGTIMEFQYMNQFQMDIDVEPEVKTYLAPVLFLQPLVENALIHGRDSNSLMLNITISGRIEGGEIHMVVKDDGKGIPPDRLQEISERNGAGSEKVQTLTSIGVSNIRERMGLLYGDQPYSLTITSEEHCGTKVEIRLPLIKGEERQNEKGITG